jgi:DNA helicase HerA-like ATPase
MNNSHNGRIKEIFDKSERIGVIGSPSSTTGLSVDILGTAVNKKLVGNLCTFNYLQDGKDHYALGQIVEVGMRNVWAEDPTMRSLIRQRGTVEPVTERQDYHFAKMSVSSVFSISSKTEPSMLGTVPSTGTSIRLMGEDLMFSLLSNLEDDLTYLGHAYGTGIKLPMWFKHFGKEQGGAGEAYHIGIFGKTGSGKSVLAKMMILGYAKNKQMSIFVLDPQGEFTKLKREEEVLSLVRDQFGKEIKFIGIHDLILSGEELFKKILVASRFLDKLSIFSEVNKARAIDQISVVLEGKARSLNPYPAKINPWEYRERENFDAVWRFIQTDEVIAKIYSGKDYQERLKSAIQKSNVEDLYKVWFRVSNLFAYGTGTKKNEIKKIVGEIKDSTTGKLIIIDLSEENVPDDIFWNEDIRKIVINELLKSLKKASDEAYKDDKLLNALVVIDEAHRLVPRDINRDDEISMQLKSTIVDGILTTRKSGLGWMFISQTLSSLDKDIINQIRAYIFGYGLAFGIERQALREILGGAEDSLNLYNSFKDPQSGFGKPYYSFMSYGPISPLSFSGVPLFFDALDFPSEYITVNFNKVKQNDH